MRSNCLLPSSFSIALAKKSSASFWREPRDTKAGSWTVASWVSTHPPGPQHAFRAKYNCAKRFPSSRVTQAIGKQISIGLGIDETRQRNQASFVPIAHGQHMAIRVRTGQWEKVRFAKSTLRLLAQKPDAIWGSDAGFELFGQIMPP